MSSRGQTRENIYWAWGYGLRWLKARLSKEELIGSRQNSRHKSLGLVTAQGKDFKGSHVDY